MPEIDIYEDSVLQLFFNERRDPYAYGNTVTITDDELAKLREAQAASDHFQNELSRLLDNNKEKGG